MHVCGSQKVQTFLIDSKLSVSRASCHWAAAVWLRRIVMRAEQTQASRKD